MNNLGKKLEDFILEATFYGIQGKLRYAIIEHSIDKIEVDDNPLKYVCEVRYTYRFSRSYKTDYNTMNTVIDLKPIREKMKELSITCFADIDELKRFIYSEIVKENQI